MNESKSIIKLWNVSKRFGDRKVLDQFCLDIFDRETLVIVGRSGVGKSTVLKHIDGLLKPDEGEVWVKGQEVTRLNEDFINHLRRKIGFVFQFAALFDSLTVFENVGFRLMRDMCMSETAAELIVKEKLELVGLNSDILHLKPAQLSGGMRKMVAVARAIAVDPEIVLYDEPTSGLDPVTSSAINDLIISMKLKLGVTSVVVTHDMESAYKVADRIAMIYDGRIIGVGTPEEIRNHTDPYIHQFITGSVVGPIPIR